MAEKEVLQEEMEMVSLYPSTSDPESGKGAALKHITHGFHLVKGHSKNYMEDYITAQTKQVDDHELGMFGIFDGHFSHSIPDYLSANLFDTILGEPDMWTDPENAIRRAYATTDSMILENESGFRNGGSTAVTAMLIDRQKLIVANVGDSRAVICKNGKAKQLSVDHDPGLERAIIENRGGFVTKFPGDIPRVDGQLAVSRAFGDRRLKNHLSCEPDVAVEMIDEGTELLILASDGLWMVMKNEEMVESIRGIDDPHSAAKHLIEEALSRQSNDDISCIVVRFR